MLITQDTGYGAAPCVAPFGAARADFAAILTMPTNLRNLDLVIAPLFGTDVDGIELIQRLGRARFKGRVQFLTKPLPNRKMVLDELRAVADGTGITVDLQESN